MKKLKEKIKKTILYRPLLIIWQLFYLLKCARKRRLVIGSNQRISLPDEISVVFIIQCAYMIDKVNSVYEAMNLDKRFRINLLCVPEEKNHEAFDISLITENKTYMYFSEKGYSCINAVNADKSFFDLRKLQPDYCIYVRPYNSLLPECYRSDVVASFSKIVLITYGALMWTEPYKLLWNYDFESLMYCNYVQDREGQLRCKRKYSLLGREKPRCIVAGLPVLENFLKRREEIKFETNIGEQVKVVWTPRWSTDKKIGGSNFCSYKDTILQYCENHGKLHLVIRPHPLMFINFAKTRELPENEADKFKQYCADHPRIRLDMSNDYVPTFWDSDILVTDFSSIIIEYFITGKPIIYCIPPISIKYTVIMKEILQHCYCVKNEQELITILDNLLKGHDSKAMARKAFADKIIKQYAEGAAERVIDDIVADFNRK